MLRELDSFWGERLAKLKNAAELFQYVQDELERANVGTGDSAVLLRDRLGSQRFEALSAYVQEYILIISSGEDQKEVYRKVLAVGRKARSSGIPSSDLIKIKHRGDGIYSRWLEKQRTKIRSSF